MIEDQFPATTHPLDRLDGQLQSLKSVLREIRSFFAAPPTKTPKPRPSRRNPRLEEWHRLWDEALTYRHEYVCFPGTIISGATIADKRRSLYHGAAWRAVWVDIIVDDPEADEYFVRVIASRDGVKLPTIKEDQ